MVRVKPNASPWLGVSLLVFVLDQWSKAWWTPAGVHQRFR